MLQAKLSGLSPEKDGKGGSVTASITVPAVAGGGGSKKEKRARHHTSIDAREVQTATVRALSKSASTRRARSRSDIDVRDVSAALSNVGTVNSRLYAPKVLKESENAPRVALTAAQKRARNKSAVNTREVNTAARSSLTKKADRRARSQSAINPADVRAAKEKRAHPFLSKAGRKSLGSPKSGSPLGSPTLRRKSEGGSSLGGFAGGTAASRGRQKLNTHTPRAHPLLDRRSTATGVSSSSRRRKLPDAPAQENSPRSSFTSRSASAPDNITVVVPNAGAPGSNPAAGGVSAELWSALNPDSETGGDDGGVGAVAEAAAAATSSAYGKSSRRKKRPGPVKAVAGKKKGAPKGGGAGALPSGVAGLRLDDFDDDTGSTVDEDGQTSAYDEDEDDADIDTDGGPLSPLGAHSPENEWEGEYDEDELDAMREAAAAEAAALRSGAKTPTGGSSGSGLVMGGSDAEVVVANSDLDLASPTASAASTGAGGSSAPQSPQLLADADIAAIMAAPAPTDMPPPPTPTMPPAPDGFMDSPSAPAPAPPGFNEPEPENDLLSLVRAPVVPELTPEQAARQAKLARARQKQAERDASGSNETEQMKRLLADSKRAATAAGELLARGASTGVAARKGSK